MEVPPCCLKVLDEFRLLLSTIDVVARDVDEGVTLAVPSDCSEAELSPQYELRDTWEHILCFTAPCEAVKGGSLFGVSQCKSLCCGENDEVQLNHKLEGGLLYSHFIILMMILTSATPIAIPNRNEMRSKWNVTLLLLPSGG